MADREKLIELLNHDLCKGKTWKDCILCEYYKRSQDCFNVAKADHLIANGVTVQRWIPVTERLPVHRLDVLVNDHGKIRIGWYAEKTNDWYTLDNDGYVASKYVTHWMPLPEPPKGE